MSEATINCPWWGDRKSRRGLREAGEWQVPLVWLDLTVCWPSAEMDCLFRPLGTLMVLLVAVSVLGLVGGTSADAVCCQNELRQEVAHLDPGRGDGGVRGCVCVHALWVSILLVTPVLG